MGELNDEELKGVAWTWAYVAFLTKKASQGSPSISLLIPHRPAFSPDT